MQKNIRIKYGQFAMDIGWLYTKCNDKPQTNKRQFFLMESFHKCNCLHTIGPIALVFTCMQRYNTCDKKAHLWIKYTDRFSIRLFYALTLTFQAINICIKHISPLVEKSYHDNEPMFIAAAYTNPYLWLSGSEQNVWYRIVSINSSCG